MQGDGNYQSNNVTLSGEGNMFTASMVTKGYYNGEQKEYIICISGEKTSGGIRNVRYGICIDGAIKEQYRDDKGQQKEREIDVYRIIKDGDGLAELKSIIDERQRKLAAEQAEQQRLAAIEKQRQDSIATVKEAERQEQLAYERAEQERIEQARINNLITVTKPLMGGKWVGGWKYNNGRYENRIILTFKDYETVNFVEESYINGNYQKTITNSNYFYQYNKPNIDMGFTSPFVFKNGIMTFVTDSGDKVTLKKVK